MTTSTFSRVLKLCLLVTPMAVVAGTVYAGSSDALTTPPLPTPCAIATSVVFDGDVTLGEGCTTLSITDGVTVDVLHAHRVEIAASTVQISGHGSATIRANGSIGAEGSPGANGDSFPFWNSQGDNDYWNARHDAERSPANGCHGRQGGKGSQGTPAANIALPTGFTVVGTLVLEAHGGASGPGGPGGRGTTLRNGRQFYCDGCMFACNSGANGSLGALGIDGIIFVGTTQRATGQLTIVH